MVEALLGAGEELVKGEAAEERRERAALCESLLLLEAGPVSGCASVPNLVAFGWGEVVEGVDELWEVLEELLAGGVSGHGVEHVDEVELKDAASAGWIWVVQIR